MRAFRQFHHLILAVVVGFLAIPFTGEAIQYEVWAIDQSDAATGGNTLYIYDGAQLVKSGCTSSPEVIDLEAASAATGVKGVRPHMGLFNAEQTHIAISHTASNTLLILNAIDRKVVANLPVDAHAAVPTPDDTFIIAADIGDNLITRIRSDYAQEKYAVVDTLDLTPFGGAAGTGGKPGPVCPIVTEDSKHMYATLSGGGLLVINIEAGKAMSVVDRYNTSEVAAAGCGGVQMAHKIYINSATPEPDSPDHIYVFDTRQIGQHPSPRTGPRPKDILLTNVNDSHGAIVAQPGRYLWFFNRDSNDITVIDTSVDEVVNTIPATMKGNPALDLAPDLVDRSPTGRYAFVAARGPNPRTANNPAVNNAVGNHPGVAVFKIAPTGRDGELICTAAITASRIDGVEQADIHGLRVRIK